MPRECQPSIRPSPQTAKHPCIGSLADGFRPFRAAMRFDAPNPGRCPGLSPCAPLGHKTIRRPTAPKGHSEAPPWGRRSQVRRGHGNASHQFAQALKRRNIHASVPSPMDSAPSGRECVLTHRSQGVALGYHLAPRWGIKTIHRPAAPKGHHEIAQGIAKRRPGEAVSRTGASRGLWL
jgi:hypothetical protein